MPYHIKTKSVLNPGIGDVYYKGGSTWTDLYDDRQVFENESDAVAVKNTTVTTKEGIVYTSKHFANAIVVSE